VWEFPSQSVSFLYEMAYLFVMRMYENRHGST